MKKSLILLATFLAFAACKKEDERTWSNVNSITIDYFKSSFAFMPDNTNLTFSFITPNDEILSTFENDSDVDKYRSFERKTTISKNDFFYIKVVQTDCDGIPNCPGTLSEINVPDSFGIDLPREWRIGMLDNSVAFIGVTYNF